MKKIALLLFLVPLAIGCNNGNDLVPELSRGGEPDKNIVPVERHDIRLTSAQKTLVSKGNTFAFNLFKEVLSREEGSFMVSPLSVEYALAMLCNGAAGNTRDEILKLLDFGNDQIDFVNEFYGYLTKELYGADNTVLLNLANALVYNTRYTGIKKDYISSLENYYDALVKGFDFSKDAQSALSFINNWADEQTYGMIPKLLSNLDPDLYLVLMNALYFKGNWNSKNKFNESDTAVGDFSVSKGKTHKEKYMYQESTIPYGYNNYFQLVSLCYGNGAYAMDLIVPHENVSLEDALSSLSKYNYPAPLGGDRFVKVKLPVFETESDKIKLDDALIDMGMKDAFDSAKADFSRMAEEKVWVSEIFQKSRIKVNEKGSEAAAVTVVMMAASAGPNFTPPPVPEVYATRPFIYIIRETSTNAILFMGVYKGR